MPGPISELVYVGHASASELYLSGSDDNTSKGTWNLTANVLKLLPKGTLSADAKVYLYGCHVGEGNLPQAVADYFGKTTYGWDGGLDFSCSFHMFKGETGKDLSSKAGEAWRFLDQGVPQERANMKKFTPTKPAP